MSVAVFRLLSAAEMVERLACVFRNVGRCETQSLENWSDLSYLPSLPMGAIELALNPINVARLSPCRQCLYPSIWTDT